MDLTLLIRKSQSTGLKNTNKRKKSGADQKKESTRIEFVTLVRHPDDTT